MSIFELAINNIDLSGEGRATVKRNDNMIKDFLILTVFMIVNILVITGILLQFEQDLKEKSQNIEKVLLQSNEIEKMNINNKLKSRSGKNSPFELNNY